MRNMRRNSEGFLNRRSGVRIAPGLLISSVSGASSGSVTGSIETPAHLSRFWEKVQILGPDACWPWLAARSSEGYGSFGFQGRVLTASRLAYIFTKGEIPDDLDVMHSCDNPPCCNPAHLSPGSRSRNMKDCADRNRIYRRSSKLSAETLDRICSDYLAGIPGPIIAAEFGFHPTYPSWLCRKRGLRRTHA